MAEIHFRRDTAFRKQVFVPDSFAHPAKMDAQLLMWLVGKYSKPGETIVDPMAGSGTTMLACNVGRNIILVELEEKFCKMMRDNWELVKMKPQLGCEMGTCQIIQGDARNLEGLLADKIITSPPFGQAQEGSGLAKNPPATFRGVLKNFTQKQGDDINNIANLPYGDIDSIITSPPYEGSEARDRSAEEWWDEDRELAKAGGSAKIAKGYQANKNNIGNLKSDTYLEAMFQCYCQFHRVLKEGGLCIIVTKNFIRNKKVVRLDTDTIKLCEQAGFSYVERHWRKLPAQSFWRIIYHKKHPEVEQINYEDVLVFKK